MSLKKRNAQVGFLILAALIFSSGCASHNRSRVIQKTESVEATTTGDVGIAPMTPEEAAEALPERNVVSSLEFEPGRRALSPESTAALNRALMEANQSGEVDEVNIVVWSDVEASAGQGQAIPRQQVEIAKERGQNIEKYIDRMVPEAEVKVHNVAQKPSSFVNFLQQQDPTVKNQLASLGITTNEATNDVKGRSSSALVLIKLK